MEPPAPLTITFLPVIQTDSRSTFGDTTSRLSKSSISTCRTSSTRALPVTMLLTGGVTLMISDSRAKLSSTLRCCGRVIEGIANRTVVTPCLRAKCSSSLAGYT